MLSDLHELFQKRPRYKYPLSAKASLPRNGIYVFFEQGETYGAHDRIVYVGSHKSGDNLQARLDQHFVGNKNRSILRKHLGRALLVEDGDDAYLPLWDLDVTTRADKEKNTPLITPEFEEALERRITAYMADNFSFATLSVDVVGERKKWTTKLAATLAQGEDNRPSEDWLGHNSPSQRIRTSGLWQVNSLDTLALTAAEFERLAELMG